jgi:uncharacterized protein (TIGR02328 family)
MRLWHEKLIPQLPRQQLLGQHRECCAMRGRGWGKKHRTVDYVWKYPIFVLYQYHCLVMEEMDNRGYHVTETWWDCGYRGRSLGITIDADPRHEISRSPLYPEHDDAYLVECLDNLRAKGILIAKGRTQ